MTCAREYVYIKDNERQLLIYEKNHLLFVFNLHSNESYTDFKFEVRTPGKYKCILSSDDPMYGGLNRVKTSIYHFTQFNNDKHYLSLYLPTLTCCVYRNMDISIDEYQVKENE